MPSRRLFLHGRPGIASASHPFSPSNPESSAVTPNAPRPPMAALRSYPNNVPEDTNCSVWDAALTVTSILDKIPGVPLALAGPLTQILDVASVTMGIIKTMREGQDGCIRLIYRVLNFLQSLVDELRTIKAPVPDDTPTAARLFALKSNLMAIRDDANRWSRLNLLEKYLKRDEIKIALSRHGENVTDCFSTFQILTSIRSSNFTDKVETVVFPGPSVLVTRSEDKHDLLVPPLAPSASLHDLLQGPAGQAMFQQIGVAVQGRLEEMGLRAASTPLASRDSATTVLQTGPDRHISYLTSQISELTAEIDSILPDIGPTYTEPQFTRPGFHRPQTGDPTPQLRESVSTTLQLLNELHSISPVKLDAALLARKMGELSLNLSDLGLRDEAFEAGTTAVVLYRAVRDMPGLAASLSQLSTALWPLGRREEGLQTTEEAVNLYRGLAGDRPDLFQPHLAQSLVTISLYFSAFGRYQEAVEVCEEALSIYRPLATGRPDVFLPDLARCLVTLSNRLSELGPHKGALQANEESVSIYRPLTGNRPDLARSLVNLSKRLSDFGRYEEALKVSEEAVSIYRPLAAHRPGAFMPRLGASLLTHSKRVLECGLPEKALEVSEEAVSIYRSLAAKRPSIFHPDLVRSLSYLFDILLALGRLHEALLAIQEAVNLLRPLAIQRPSVFSARLAALLTMLSCYYSDMGYDEDSQQARKGADDLNQWMQTVYGRQFSGGLAGYAYAFCM